MRDKTGSGYFLVRRIEIIPEPAPKSAIFVQRGITTNENSSSPR